MDSVITFFNENEMLVYALLCLFLLILVCFIPRKKNKKEEIEEVKTEIKEEKEEPIKEEVKKFEDLTKEDIKDIVNDDTFIYEQATFHEEDKVNELDNLLAIMEHDLELEKAQEETLEDYEDEQEKTAIISYQELLKAARENKIKTSYDDEEAAIITTKPKVKETPVLEEIKKEEELSETKKFKNSDFISPIFGKQETVSNYPKVPNFNRTREQKVKIDDEEVINFDHNTDEEFLENLIAFRNNLK